jgi:pilus assembly protein Flp/PilA
MPAHRRHPFRYVARLFRDVLSEEDGPTAVEYAVMLALIIGVCISAVTQLGTNLNSSFESSNTAMFGN